MKYNFNYNFYQVNFHSKASSCLLCLFFFILYIIIHVNNCIIIGHWPCRLSSHLLMTMMTAWSSHCYSWQHMIHISKKVVIFYWKFVSWQGQKIMQQNPMPAISAPTSDKSILDFVSSTASMIGLSHHIMWAQPSFFWACPTSGVFQPCLFSFFYSL